MIRGFYTALSGIIGAMTRQDVVADNIANANTPGFKQSRTVARSFEMELQSSAGYALGPLGTATGPVGLTLDPTMGPIEPTGSPTDLAIEGDGLFVVRDGAGVAYTRAGDLTLDANGTLTSQDGRPVLDTTGRQIVVPGGPTSLVVGSDGAVDGTGQRIAVVAWPAGGPTRMGDNLYAIAGPTMPATGLVRQGFLEHSNTDMTLAMGELIDFQQQMSLTSRILSIEDGTLGDTVVLGRLR